MRTADIELTLAELMLAVHCGGLCHAESLSNGRKDRVPGAACDWTIQIDSRAAEIAVAKFYGLRNFVPRVNAFKLPDVGPLQVRSTRKDNGPLRIRPGDSDNETFLLVITDTPWYYLRGAYLGGAAKQAIYWIPENDFGPGYWAVPQAVLDHLPDRSAVLLAKGA